MGGDGTAQIIAEYISRQGGFIALIIVICSLCLLAIVAGVVLTIIGHVKAGKLKNEAAATNVEEKKEDK